MKPVTHFGLGLAVSLALLSLPAGGQSQAPSNSTDQSSSESLGSYARQIRKDSGPRSKPKVYDNDNLPKEDKLSVIGEAQPAAETPVATSEETKPPEPTVGEAKPEAKGEAKSEAKSETKSEGKTGETAATEENKASGESKAPASTKPPATSPDDDPAARQAAWKQWQDRIAKQKEQIDLLTRELDVLQREYQLRAAAMYADAGNRLRNEAAWDKQDAQYKQQIADKQKALDDAKAALDNMEEDARKSGVPASMREP
jgi:hypothetical protein